MPCGCQNVAELLSSLGAEHAKKLQASGGADHPSGWRAADWLSHMEEEERLFFPLLPERWRARLASEHETFRRQLTEDGAIDEDLAARHAALEDWLVVEEMKWRIEFRNAGAPR